jgi:phage FluMu protein Com
MPFKTECPACTKGLQVPNEAVGKRVKCPACAHAWQVAPPVAAVSEVPEAAPAPIRTKCSACNKVFQVPGTAAGKQVKCPACAHVWQVGAAVAAESLPELPKAGGWFDELMNDQYPLEAVKAGPVAAVASSPFAASAGPAPAATGVSKKRKKQRGPSDPDDEMTTTDWVICIIFPIIGIIGGLIYMCTGKKKGFKVLAISVLVAAVCVVIRLATMAPGGR